MMTQGKSQKPQAAPRRCCGYCRHFCNDPAAMEAAFPGLNIMSSGHASVRAQDGLCNKHEVYLAFTDVCGDFETRVVQSSEFKVQGY